MKTRVHRFNEEIEIADAEDSTKKMFDSLTSKADKLSPAKKVLFWSAFSDRLSQIFIEETPGADQKYKKFLKQLKSDYTDIIKGEEKEE
jgi:hypothetical protein